MALNEELENRIRQALSHLPNVEEKKMFGRNAFMVNGKLCLTAGDERMMCRIDPEVFDEALKMDGCSALIMKGREYKGWVNVDENYLRTKKEFSYWVNLALDFNAKSVTGKKPPRKTALTKTATKKTASKKTLAKQNVKSTRKSSTPKKKGAR